MRIALGILLGVVVALTAVYLVVAFIYADWAWASGMFSAWSRQDRGWFAYFTFFLCVGSGALGAAFSRNILS